MLWLQHMSYSLDKGSANYTHDVRQCASCEPDLRSPTYVLRFLVRLGIVLSDALFLAFQLKQTAVAG